MGPRGVVALREIDPDRPRRQPRHLEGAQEVDFPRFHARERAGDQRLDHGLFRLDRRRLDAGRRLLPGPLLALQEILDPIAVQEVVQDDVPGQPKDVVERVFRVPPLALPRLRGQIAQAGHELAPSADEALDRLVEVHRQQSPGLVFRRGIEGLELRVVLGQHLLQPSPEPRLQGGDVAEVLVGRPLVRQVTALAPGFGHVMDQWHEKGRRVLQRGQHGFGIVQGAVSWIGPRRGGGSIAERSGQPFPSRCL